MDDESLLKRREARALWPGGVYRLGSEPPAFESGATTPEERLGMMWRLALDAWAGAGRCLPTYTRATMPGRVFHRDDPPSDYEDE